MRPRHRTGREGRATGNRPVGPIARPQRPIVRPRADIDARGGEHRRRNHDGGGGASADGRRSGIAGAAEVEIRGADETAAPDLAPAAVTSSPHPPTIRPAAYRPLDSPCPDALRTLRSVTTVAGAAAATPPDRAASRTPNRPTSRTFLTPGFTHAMPTSSAFHALRRSEPIMFVWCQNRPRWGLNLSNVR